MRALRSCTPSSSFHVVHSHSCLMSGKVPPSGNVSREYTDTQSRVAKDPAAGSTEGAEGDNREKDARPPMPTAELPPMLEPSNWLQGENVRGEKEDDRRSDEFVLPR